MTSLKDAAAALWPTDTALLIAGGCTHALSRSLDAADRGVYESLRSALVDWVGKRQGLRPVETTPLSAIVDAEFRACQNLSPNDNSPLMLAAYVQMAIATRHIPLVGLPEDHPREVGVTQFLQTLTQAGKIESIPRKQIVFRMERLVGLKWADQIATTARMGWGRVGLGWSKLPSRLEELARELDAGATYTWSDVGGRSALRVVTGSEQRMGVLSREEVHTIRAVLPWLTDPAAL